MAEKKNKVKAEDTAEKEVKAPSLTEQLETAQKEAAEYKDMALRKMAELENYRRNNQSLASDVRERTVKEVLEGVLPALDSFDRAEPHIKDESTKKGFMLVKEQLNALLKKYSVEAIPAVDEDFNPEVHDCIMQVASEDKDGKVIYEIERGYRIGDRILRHSKVAVGKSQQEHCACGRDHADGECCKDEKNGAADNGEAQSNQKNNNETNGGEKENNENK